MKNIFLSVVLALIANTLTSQETSYQAAMTQAVAALDSTSGIDAFQASANAFSRIAAARPTEWLPYYYAAFSNLQAAFPLFQRDAAKATLILDLAQASLDKAKTLAPEESELSVLQAYLYIGRLMEDPMSKGAQITPMVFGELGKAAAQNPQNPRAPFLKGTYVLNMPEFYGGGVENARPYFEKAATLFEAEANRGLLPHWGRKANTGYLKQISEEGGN
ncbi:MAG: hypothetical protein EP344_06095 [Bacteroidetes bacterium]|nr:MAG: hypothetical protein EP344_06095 [Bacteroidota bacterium]